MVWPGPLSFTAVGRLWMVVVVVIVPQILQSTALTQATAPRSPPPPPSLMTAADGHGASLLVAARDLGDGARQDHLHDDRNRSIKINDGVILVLGDVPLQPHRTLVSDRSGLYNVVRHGSFWGQPIASVDTSYADNFTRMGVSENLVSTSV